MNGKRLIEKIKLRNILSFGDTGEEIELQPLNIIIGQNGSGKSNFIQIIKLLKDSANGYLANTIRNNGGIDEYLWKGSLGFPLAEISLTMIFEKIRRDAICYSLKFTKSGQYFELTEEEIVPVLKKDDGDFYYRNKNGNVEIVRWGKLKEEWEDKINRELQTVDISGFKSFLSTV